MRAAIATLLVSGFATTIAVVACSSPDTNGRIDPIGPSTKDFKAVSTALVWRCGSLDCHGSRYRNLRLYGFGGLRLDASDPRVSPETPTIQTDDEAAANYDAIIALEPEVMRDVVADRGARSDRLTFVRKGRGDEDHKGGRRITPGDSADRCVQSWLRGEVDVAACEEVPKQP